MRAPWRPRPDEAAALDDVAGAVERLRALVLAGASPESAWRYLAEGSASSGLGGVATGIAQALRAGAPVAPVLAGATAARHWIPVVALMDLASDVGAPLAEALDRAAAALRAASELHRAVAASVAGPAASARLTLLLPPGAGILGWAFGFDVPGALLSPLGAGGVALAVVLLAGAGRWSGRLIRSASGVEWERGLGLELVALAVRAGRPTPDAVRDAQGAAAGSGVGIDEDLAVVRQLVAFAERSGAPLAALLDAEADRVRRAVLGAARLRANALAVRLLLPLGALVLPAFLLAGALPVGLAVLSSTALSW